MVEAVGNVKMHKELLGILEEKMNNPKREK